MVAGCMIKIINISDEMYGSLRRIKGRRRKSPEIKA